LYQSCGIADAYRVRIQCVNILASCFVGQSRRNLTQKRESLCHYHWGGQKSNVIREIGQLYQNFLQQFFFILNEILSFFETKDHSNNTWHFLDYFRHTHPRSPMCHLVTLARPMNKKGSQKVKKEVIVIEMGFTKLKIKNVKTINFGYIRFSPRDNV